jgi:hypothetical protein
MSSEIADLSTVSPQCTFLESHPQPPEADSTLYLTLSATDNISGGQDHTVVGVHIVLAAGNTNKLWEAFHIDRNAQKLNATQKKKDSLTICCDTLEVHGELCVPEADVTIYARRLVWASEDAAINTSPLLWELPNAANAQGATPGADGANGRNAGSVRAFVSVVEPSDDRQIRLKACGGQGQNPGEGLNGKPGTSLPDSWTRATFEARIALVGFTNSATVDFDPPAVYIDASWGALGISEAFDPRGSNSFPTSGTDAIAPGIPGDGGGGGNLTTNSRAAIANFRNDGGPAGKKALNRVGGRAGGPSRCARYRVALTEWLGNTDKASFTKTMIAGPNTTTKGKDASAKPARNDRGATPPAAEIDCANAWLHPLSLQAVLEFARDLFLAEARVELQQRLQDYEAALALPIPKSMEHWDDCPWGDASPAQWTAAQTEVASMLTRLNGHLDYFGNPAGYTPLLSLQGSIKLYEGETRRALRTMLLVDWVNAETSKAQDASDMLGALVDGMNEDSSRAADQVTAAEKTLGELASRLSDLEQQLSDKNNALAAKQTELLGQAKTTLQQEALIRSSIKMAGAICQVIPVGQPALGVVGSLAGVAADLGSDSKGVPDTVSRMGDVISKAREAANKAADANKKAANPSKEAADASKKAPDASTGQAAKPKDTDTAKKGASAMSTALDGLGPALSQASGAIAASQVPQSAVDAELQRLEAECPEMQQLIDEIRDLNVVMSELFDELTDAFQSLGDGCSRLSSNAAAIVSMQQQRGKQLGRIDHEASLFVQQAGHRSRLTLLKYLYFMVKAYETTMLRSLDTVDWKLSQVTAKINELLQGVKSFDDATLETKAQTLEGLFQDNINVVRQQLLDDASRFSEITMPRPLVLSSTQSPEDVATLNATGHVAIDPFEYGLIDPKTQLARLSDASLDSLEFDPKGPALPDGKQVAIDLVPARVGTLRRAESLYAIYSEAPVRWTWTFSGGRLEKSPPSKGAKDLLDFILGDGSEKIRQKIARPPFWSALDICVRYLPELPANQKPRITRLQFRLSSDVTSAPNRQSVLMVHPIGLSPGAVVDCSPKDLAGRQAGLGHFMRIYNQGVGVQLSVPAAFGADFDHWQLLGTSQSNDCISKLTIPVQLTDDVTVQCYWVHADDRVARFELTSEQLTRLAQTHPDEGIRESLQVLFARKPADVPEPPAPGIAQLIRVEPDDEASVVGLVPPDGIPDVLQEGKNGWREVNYRRVSGWIRA